MTWNRSQLLTLLSEASELEHGLACSYLYAAFSLKQDLEEGGLTWQQLQKTRLWASQILHVAAEEMLHLAQAWNLLTAIGGSPWFGRPNFPQPSTYYPLHLPLETRPFSLDVLDRFITFERPHDPDSIRPPAGDDQMMAFRTVGELYALIADGITALPEQRLFVSDATSQVDSTLVDFPDLIPVVDCQSALRAITMITEQGEGTPGDRDDSHFDIFQRVRKSFLAETLDANPEFSPVRPCVANPTAYAGPLVGLRGASPIADVQSAVVADVFDQVYLLMLRLLQYVFDGGTNDADGTLSTFADTALDLMTTVVKPLGEALMLMPAGKSVYGGATAGPPFTIARNIHLPLTAGASRVVEASDSMSSKRVFLISLPLQTRSS